MALKFLNKKGWHTGSLRNIENVWKAEQKHDAEQKKLEELRKQIQEERERSEFRKLQEQAGLVPRQERLDFLYESGLAVGKGSEGFKALETPATAAPSSSATADASSSKAAVPGALFEDKPQSANDTWRKLHSDPLLLIRQHEQEALARIKNNPVQMALIRKSVEAEKNHKKDDKGKRGKKKHKRKHHHKLKSENSSDSANTSGSEEDGTKRNGPKSNLQKHSKRKHSSIDRSGDEDEGTNSAHLPSDRHQDKSSKHERHSSRVHSDSKFYRDSEEDRRKSQRSTSERRYRHEDKKEDRHEEKSSKHENSRACSDSKYSSESEEDRRKIGRSTSDRHHQYSHGRYPSKHSNRDEDRKRHVTATSEHHHTSSQPAAENKETQMRSQQGPAYNRRKGVPKMTEEEREAKLREMQLDAELHEEQRWKRIKKQAEADAQEAAQANISRGKNFLDEAQKSIYGTEKGGSSTIEESVRRRAYYSQGGTDAHESNAFRR